MDIVITLFVDVIGLSRYVLIVSIGIDELTLCIEH